MAALLIIFIIIQYANVGGAFKSGKKSQEYRRIISMAPNITETIFALGLQKKLVGVTDFCNYPLAAKSIDRVGGYLNPNYEALISLKPDLVIVLPEQANIRQYVEELDIDILQIDNKKVDDIINSILDIGKTCGAAEKADTLVKKINRRMALVRKRVNSFTKYSVLLSIGRTAGSGNLSDVYVAGKNTYFDELISMAGGVNVVKNELVDYPLLSAEGIIRLNPDVIIDLVLKNDRKGLTNKQLQDDWQAAAQVNAFKNNRYYILDSSYTVIPGPRFINLLEDLSLSIHPE